MVNHVGILFEPWWLSFSLPASAKVFPSGVAKKLASAFAAVLRCRPLLMAAMALRVSPSKPLESKSLKPKTLCASLSPPLPESLQPHKNLLYKSHRIG